MTEDTGSEKIVRRRLADGTIRVYRYRRKGKRVLRGSLGALIQEYRRSTEFAKLAPNTVKGYLRAMGHMVPLYESAIAEIRRRHIVKLRDRFRDRPGIANQLVAVFSVLMKYAVEMEYRENNPARGIPFLATGEHTRWPEEAIAFAMERFPERFRRAVVLALYTGQRQADVLAMRWSDYDGDGINVVQQKTGTKLWIPCPAALKAELDAWRAEGVTATTVLTDSRGRPYRIETFATLFSAQVRAHVELQGLVFHGLRKTAAARLAEAGCSPHEIGAITGHKTLAMLQLYTLEAEQKTRARAAVVKLENAGRRGRTERETG